MDRNHRIVDNHCLHKVTACVKERKRPYCEGRFLETVFLNLKKLYLGVLLTLAIPFFVFSQKQDHKKLGKLAQELLEVEDYQSGCPIVDYLDSLGEDKPQLKFYKGLCLYKLGNKAASLPYILSAKNSNYYDPDMNFLLGRAYHFNLQFDSAAKYYRLYLSKLDTLHRHKKLGYRFAEVNTYLRNCEAGKNMLQDSLDIFIENVGPLVNSPFPDYSPVISADESLLLFTSRRPNSTGGELADDGKYYEDIYMSLKDSTGKWGAPVQLGDTINSPGHDACVGLSPDGQKLYIYRSWRRKDSSGDLYLSELKGHNWSRPQKLHGDINSKNWESSVSVSPNEGTIYFASDRKEGLGGNDIYCVRKKEDGNYGPAMNLGPVVNTPYDDDSPLIHADNKTLFFSSKGHAGMGGFDVFSSTFNEKDSTWSKPENLGYPISTPGDDIYFAYTADGSKGYFSSYRNDSYGEKDIYIIHRPADSSGMVVFKGLIKDSETQQAIAATITVSDPVTGKVENVFNSNSATGKYLVILAFNRSYNVTMQAQGYMYKSEQITIPEQRANVFQYVRNFFLDLIKKPADNVAANEFQKQQEMEEVGVPGAKKKKYDSKFSDTLKAHSLYYMNAYLANPRDTALEKHLDILGSDSGFIIRKTITYNEAYFEAESDNMYTMNISMEKLKPGAKFILRNIHFDYDKDTIRKSSEPELNRLLTLLQQNKTLVLEIGGHTDNHGTLEYNIDLSKRRAQSVVKYLVKRGVEASRLRFRGYGETIPITSNKTDFGRQFNRRTEFEVLDTTSHYLNHPIKSKDHRISEDYWRELPMKAHFEPNVADKIYPFSKERLDELVDFLHYNKKVKIALIARADPSLEEDIPMLIEKRATIVRNYLIKKGIDKSRIKVTLPEDLPQHVAPTVVKGEISSRRVEFYIVN
jgi:outer membrane protein OmpA-like peptidoglycan-associated protein